MAFVGPQRALLSAGYQPESLLIFAAFTTLPTTARKALINACVVALKNAGVWAKLDALYMLAAADSQAALINWVNPGTYNATAINSPTFTADQGFTGANTKYIDSGFNPTVGSNQFIRDSACQFVWSGTSGQVAAGAAGIAASDTCSIWPRYTDNICYWRINAASDGSVANADGSGFYVASRTSSSLTTMYRNGSLIGTGNANSSALTNSNLVFLRTTATFWTGLGYCGGIGAGLTLSDASSLYSALHSYLQTVAGIA